MCFSSSDVVQVHIYPHARDDEIQSENVRRDALIELVKKMLILDQDDRIKPDDALPLVQFPAFGAHSASITTIRPARKIPNEVIVRGRWRLAQLQ